MSHAPPVDLPVLPPVKPMLAKAIADVPDGDFLYEPEWDGFRRGRQFLGFLGWARVDDRRREEGRRSPLHDRVGRVPRLKSSGRDLVRP